MNLYKKNLVTHKENIIFRESREALEINMLEAILNSEDDKKTDDIMSNIRDRNINFIGKRTGILLSLLQKYWLDGENVSARSFDSCIPTMLSCMTRDEKDMFLYVSPPGYGKYIDKLLATNIPKCWKSVLKSLHISQFRQDIINIQAKGTKVLIDSQNNILDIPINVERIRNELDEKLKESLQIASSNNRSIKEIINSKSFYGEDLMGHLERIKSLCDSGQEDPRAINTGYMNVDRLLGGIYENTLMILAARPSMGKTALALCIANNIINSSTEETSKAILFFSLEMSSQQLIQRVISIRTDIGLSNLIRGDLTSHNFIELYRIKQSPEYDEERFFNNFMINTECTKIGQISLAIRSYIEKLENEGGNRKLSAVFIDYLQLVLPDRKEETKNVEVSNISRMLKLVSMGTGVPIICLSQLSRGVEYRATKIPVLSDLRDSGSIEQDADQVLLLVRPERNDPDTDRIGECDVHIAKNRQGETGVATISYISKTTRFINIDTNRSMHREIPREYKSGSLGITTNNEYDPWREVKHSE